MFESLAGGLQDLLFSRSNVTGQQAEGMTQSLCECEESLLGWM